MKYIETPLKGAYIIELEPIKDNRGFFARAYCEKQFVERDLETIYPQINISYNHSIGTWRGFHYQASPYQEVKVVRCVRGAIWDVIIDLRRDSDTYCKSFGVELSETNYKALYVPEDFAHGYLTLEFNSTVLYQVSEEYNKKAERGVMWNDLAFDLVLPMDPIVISDRDKVHPKYER